MSNYLVLAIVVLTAAPILFGVLLGLLRGSRRALLRLILIVLSAVIAFVLCGMVADKIVEVDVSQSVEDAEGPITLGEFVAQLLGEEMSGLGDVVLPIVQSIIKVVSFLMLFGLLWFITWLIVFPIFKIFIKPKQVRDASGRLIKKKRALFGGIFGLVQGIIVALIVCVVFNGFFMIADDVVEISDGIAEISKNLPSEEAVAYAEDGESEGESGGETVGNGGGMGDILGGFDVKGLLAEYKTSTLAQLYNKVGAKPFDMLTQIKTADERTITLNGQLGAFKGIVNIAKEFTSFANMDMNTIYEEESIAQVKTILTNIQNIRKGMSDESKETVDKLLSTLSDAMGVNLSFLSKIDSMNVENEGKALETLGRLAQEDWSNKSEEELKEDAKELIENLGKSELLFDVLDELLGDQDLDIAESLGEEMTEQIENAFDELVADGTLTQEKVDRLRNLLGLNDQSSNTLALSYHQVAMAR